MLQVIIWWVIWTCEISFRPLAYGPRFYIIFFLVKTHYFFSCSECVSRSKSLFPEFKGSLLVNWLTIDFLLKGPETLRKNTHYKCISTLFSQLFYLVLFSHKWFQYLYQYRYLIDYIIEILFIQYQLYRFDCIIVKHEVVPATFFEKSRYSVSSYWTLPLLCSYINLSS